MAKRTFKSSRPAGAGRTTTSVEPSAPPVAAPLTELEEPTAGAVAAPLTELDPPAADVAVPLTALDPPAPPASPAPPPVATPRNALIDTGAKSTPPPQPPTVPAETKQIDDAIGHLIRLHRAITGRDVPVSTRPYAPIPAKKDPVQHVDEQLDRLLDMLTWFARHIGMRHSVPSR